MPYLLILSFVGQMQEVPRWQAHQMSWQSRICPAYPSEIAATMCAGEHVHTEHEHLWLCRRLEQVARGIMCVSQ